MHSKPGRPSIRPQRWFVEADERWFFQHKHEGAETVANLLLDNFRENAGPSVKPNDLVAHQWRHAFVETPATMPRRTQCFWDDKVRLGVCGDRVVSSQIERGHGSGVDMARAVTEGLISRGGRSGFSTDDRNLGPLLKAQL